MNSKLLVYINGKLFAENIRKSAFNRQMREQLLDCCEFDWSQISPAIFGNLFQYVMDPEKREERSKQIAGVIAGIIASGLGSVVIDSKSPNPLLPRLVDKFHNTVRRFTSGG